MIQTLQINPNLPHRQHSIQLKQTQNPNQPLNYHLHPLLSSQIKSAQPELGLGMKRKELVELKARTRKEELEERVKWEEERRKRLVVMNFRPTKRDDEEELRRLLMLDRLISDKAIITKEKKTKAGRKPIYFVICQDEQEVAQCEETRNKILWSGDRFPFLIFRDRSFSERKSGTLNRG